MRKLLISSVGVLSALIVMGPAVAADLKVSPKRERAAQPAQQTSNWSGNQVGGSNGGSSVNNNFVEPGAYNFTGGCGGTCYETPFSFSGNPGSYIIGGLLGYRQQMGSVVVGIEGDVNWKKGETSKVQTGTTPGLVSETFTGSQKQGVDGSVRARIGYLVTQQTLLYLTGGLAVGRVSGSFSYSGCTVSGCPSVGSTNVIGAATWSDTRVGGTVGVGAETQVAPGVTARVEYRYTDLGKYSKDVPLTNNTGCLPPTCGNNAHIDLRAFNHRVMVGLALGL